jgi:1-acyl-sn-glycerol-3-phosphate acyltransferase
MQWIRLAVRFPAAILWTALIIAVRLSFWPLAFFSERADRRLRRGLVRLWSHLFFRFIGMRVVVEGPMPRPPFLLVSNHVSYVDTWLLNGLLGCTFVAKADIARWPVLGFISKSLHALFIDRSRKRDTLRINGLIRHAMEQGDAIVIFAESRISRGIDVEPFKSALIEPAAANLLPVHFAAIHYETLPGSPPANEVVGWWRPEPLAAHFVRLLRQPGFTAIVRFCAEPIQGDNRKSLASALHAGVRDLFIPIR